MSLPLALTDCLFAGANQIKICNLFSSVTFYGILFKLIVIRFLYRLVLFQTERRIKIMKKYLIIRKEWIMLFRPCLLVLCFCMSTSNFIFILYNDDFFIIIIFLSSTRCRLHRIYISLDVHMWAQNTSYI